MRAALTSMQGSMEILYRSVNFMLPWTQQPGKQSDLRSKRIVRNVRLRTSKALHRLHWPAS